MFGTKKSPWLAEQSYSEPWGCYELRRAKHLNALLVVGLTYRAAVFIWDLWPFLKQGSKMRECLRSGHIVFNPLSQWWDRGIFALLFYTLGNQGIQEASMARPRGLLQGLRVLQLSPLLQIPLPLPSSPFPARMLAEQSLGWVNSPRGCVRTKRQRGGETLTGKQGSTPLT